MEDGDRTRRSVLFAGAISVGSTISGCLRLAGGGGTPTSTQTKTIAAGVPTTEFAFEYLEEGGEGDGSLQIRHDGGDPIVAENLEIRSSVGYKVTWNMLGSTSKSASDPVRQGDTATIDATVLNWPSDVSSDELIRLVFVAPDGSPTTLDSFTVGRSTQTVTASESSADNVIAAYNFDGSGTEVKDRSGNGPDGKLVNDPKRVEGRGGKVVQFDKSENQYAEFGSPDTLDPQSESYSARLWFRTANVTGANETLLSKRGDNNVRFRLQLKSGGEVQFGLQDDPGMGGSKVRSSQTYDDDEWHKVLAVRDTEASEMRLYIDDTLIDSGEDKEDDIDPNGPLFIAGQPDYPNPRYYSGFIDDVKIFDSALDNGG